MNINGNDIELLAIEPEDFTIIKGILAGQRVAETLFGYPAKLLAADFSEWLAGSLKNKNECYFTVKETAFSATIGMCAYQEIDYRNGSVTVWAALMPDFKSFGAETLRVLSKNAFDQMRMEHIALYILENDINTKEWAKEAGFSLDAVLYSRIKGKDRRLNLELHTLLKEDVGNG